MLLTCSETKTGGERIFPVEMSYRCTWNWIKVLVFVFVVHSTETTVDPSWAASIEWKFVPFTLGRLLKWMGSSIVAVPESVAESVVTMAMGIVRGTESGYTSPRTSHSFSCCTSCNERPSLELIVLFSSAARLEKEIAIHCNGHSWCYCCVVVCCVAWIFWTSCSRPSADSFPSRPSVPPGTNHIGRVTSPSFRCTCGMQNRTSLITMAIKNLPTTR